MSKVFWGTFATGDDVPPVGTGWTELWQVDPGFTADQPVDDSPIVAFELHIRWRLHDGWNVIHFDTDVIGERIALLFGGDFGVIEETHVRAISEAEIQGSTEHAESAPVDLGTGEPK